MSAASHMNALLGHALLYAERGWHVFPCLPLKKAPATPHGFKDASADPGRIERWASRPGNVAISTGPSGLVVVDIDCKNGKDGFGSLDALQRKLGALPPTLTARTPTGGEHRYFLRPSGVTIPQSNGKIATAIDVRASTGYVLAPPSTTPHGAYEWIDQHEPAELPAAWIEALTEPEQPDEKRQNVADFPRGGTDIERRAIAYIARMPEAISGSGGHNAIFQVAATLACGFALSEQDTFRILRDHYNHRCRPEWSEKELMHKARQGAAAKRERGYLLKDDRRDWREFCGPDDAAKNQGGDHRLDSSAAPPKAAPSGSWLDNWQTIADLGGWLTEPPPPQEWLLTRTDEETGESKGVLDRGVVGMLSAPGARGKSWALTQLAISTATGRPWLDTYSMERPGYVLLANAEASPTALRRRLYWTARALGLTREERELAEQRIVPLGLAGNLVGLIENDGRKVAPSPLYLAMTAKLAEREWSLVILDPLSRWAPGAENTNDAATLAISLMESFTKGPGSPNVLFAHHTSKWAQRDGNKSDSPGSRGVSGLRDGVRWEAKLTGVSETDLALEMTKGNDAPPCPKLPLMRDEDTGYLRPLSLVESAERSARLEAKDAAVRAEVLAAIVAEPGIGSKALYRRINRRQTAIRTAIEQLIDTGAVDNRGARGTHAFYAAGTPEDVTNG